MQRQSSPDRKGQTRLFVAKGKRDGMSAKKLVEFIKRETGVKDSSINDFSFTSK